MEPARELPAPVGHERAQQHQQPPQVRPLLGQVPAPAAEPDPSAARLMAMLEACAAPAGSAEPSRRRVPGTHTAESLERLQTAPPPPRPRPLGPPPGLAPPDLTQALLAQLRQPVPWPQLWPGPLAPLPPGQSAPWGPPWPGR